MESGLKATCKQAIHTLEEVIHIYPHIEWGEQLGWDEGTYTYGERYGAIAHRNDDVAGGTHVCMLLKCRVH